MSCFVSMIFFFQTALFSETNIYIFILEFRKSDVSPGKAKVKQGKGPLTVLMKDCP